MKHNPTRRRTRAREIALQILYQIVLRGEPISDMEELVTQDAKDNGEIAAFTRRLVAGTLEHQEEADAILKQVACNWDVKRMATVDRNVLRMAVFELVHCPDIPPKVTINEAIELGKRFSTARSGGFVNGILDRVRIDLEAARKAAPPQDELPAGEESGGV